MRVNLGCGQAYMEGWVNVDEMPEVKADVYANAFEFVQDHGPEIQELYMGHFLEHLLPNEVRALLQLVVLRLPPGATVSAVTPDIRADLPRLRGRRDLERDAQRLVHLLLHPAEPPRLVL